MKDSRMAFSLISLRNVSLCAALFCAAPVLAQPSEPQGPQLWPEMDCADYVCTITMTGVFEGQTLRAEPLPMAVKMAEGQSAQPVALTREQTLMEGVKNSHGWLWGKQESEQALFLTPLFEDEFQAESASGSTLFMVHQMAGFEHVGHGYQFLSVSYEGDALVTALQIAPSIGPSEFVLSADTTGVTTKQNIFDPVSGDFTDTKKFYEWYSGAAAPMLGTQEEMERIYEQNDIAGNVPE